MDKDFKEGLLREDGKNIRNSKEYLREKEVAKLQNAIGFGAEGRFVDYPNIQSIPKTASKAAELYLKEVRRSLDTEDSAEKVLENAKERMVRTEWYKELSKADRVRFNRVPTANIYNEYFGALVQEVANQSLKKEASQLFLKTIRETIVEEGDVERSFEVAKEKVKHSNWYKELGAFAQNEYNRTEAMEIGERYFNSESKDRFVAENEMQGIKDKTADIEGNKIRSDSLLNSGSQKIRKLSGGGNKYFKEVLKKQSGVLF